MKALRLPNVPVDLTTLLFLSMKYYVTAFKKIFLFIIGLVVVKDAPVYFGGMPTNVYAKTAIELLMVVLSLYLIVSMLSLVYRLFTDDKSDDRLITASFFVEIIPRFLKSLLVLVGFVLIFVFILLLAHGMIRWFSLGERGSVGSLFFLLGIGILIMLVYTQFFFVIPLIAMKNLSIVGAVKRASRLITNKENWFRVFALYVFFLILWMLISPSTLHGHFMEVHKLSALFDWVVLGIAFPLLINLIVLMYNDLNLRKKLA